MDRCYVYLRLGLALGVLLTSGCARTAFRSGGLRANCLPASIASEYDYPRRPDCPCRMRLLETKAEYAMHRVELMATACGESTNRWIQFDYYDLPGNDRTPVIMVLPMLGGGYGLERHFAAYFASRGYASVIVHRDKRTKVAKAEDFDRLLREMVLDHKQVIDWMETRAELDCARLGIFGVSMGGIKGALLVALEERIQAAALGLAGGDLPYILTHTTEPGLTKRREAELKALHLTLEQAEQRLRELIKCDPIAYASYVDPEKVLLVLARYDTVVPIEKGLELKEKMGNPETIMLAAGHYSAVLSVPYIKSQSFEFFERRFAQRTAQLEGKAKPSDSISRERRARSDQNAGAGSAHLNAQERP